MDSWTWLRGQRGCFYHKGLSSWLGHGRTDEATGLDTFSQFRAVVGAGKGALHLTSVAADAPGSVQREAVGRPGLLRSSPPTDEGPPRAAVANGRPRNRTRICARTTTAPQLTSLFHVVPYGTSAHTGPLRVERNYGFS